MESRLWREPSRGSCRRIPGMVPEIRTEGAIDGELLVNGANDGELLIDGAMEGMSQTHSGLSLASGDPEGRLLNDGIIEGMLVLDVDGAIEGQSSP